MIRQQTITLSAVRGGLFDCENMAMHNAELFMLGRIIWILLLTLLTAGYVAVALRLWVRYRITKNPGWDDAAMVLTLVSLF